MRAKTFDDWRAVTREVERDLPSKPDYGMAALIAAILMLVEKVEDVDEAINLHG